MATVLLVSKVADEATSQVCRQRLEAAGLHVATFSLGQDPELHGDHLRSVLASTDSLLLICGDSQISPGGSIAHELAVDRDLPCILSVPKNAFFEAQDVNARWDLILDATIDDLASVVAVIEQRKNAEPLEARTMVVAPSVQPPKFGVPPVAPDPTHTFRSTEQVAAWAIGMVAAASILNVFEAVSGFRQVMILFAGGTQAVSKATILSDAFDTVLLLEFLLLILGAIAVLSWIVRSVKNLPALGVKNYPYSPALTAGSFFIPIACLYVPYKAMADLARASMPFTPSMTKTSWNSNSAPLVSILWTTFWISSNILSTIQNKVLVDTHPASDGKSWATSVLMLASGTATIIAGVCLCLLILKITRWQHQRCPTQAPIELGFSKPARPYLAIVISGLMIAAALAVAAPKAFLDPEQIDPWFSQRVPGTEFSASLPESVKPDVDQVDGATISNWTAEKGIDTFSIIDYQFPEGIDVAKDPQEVTDVVEGVGKGMGTLEGSTSAVFLQSLKGSESTVNVTQPMVPSGTQAILRGFAQKNHIVVFVCLLSAADSSQTLESKFFQSISFNRSNSQAPK